MLPGKKIGAEDMLLMLRRRFWLLIVPFAVLGAITAAIARNLPDSYESQAVIQIVPQRVPENYVKSTVTARIADRLQSIKERILSRTRLEQIIKQFDLYAEERRTELPETIVGQMRKDIVVGTRGTDSFTVTYVGRDATTVMRVTDQLANLFIAESQLDRQELADGTDRFLDQQLIEARNRLADQEKKLEVYKTKYSGQLPTQVGSNLQAVANIQMQIQQLVQADNRDSDRRLAIEHELKDLETAGPAQALALASNVTTGPQTPSSPVLSTTRQTLEAAKQQLVVLRQRYSDAWPDVQAQKRYVDDLQRKADAEELQRPVSMAATAAAPVSTAELQLAKKTQGLRDQLAEIERQMGLRKKEQERLRTNADTLQQRVDAVPARESEMTELTRDYATFSSLYTSLLAKKEESKIAANLLTEQIGEQFKQLDRARLPEKPSSPNRPLIILFGMAAGLGIGFGLVVLLEYRNTSFATDGDVVGLLSLPVLAVVPVMESPEDRRRAKRRRLLIGLGLGSTVAGCLAVVLFTFVR